MPYSDYRPDLMGTATLTPSGSFEAGSNPQMQTLASEAISKMRAALEDDLNTAQAQAARSECTRNPRDC